MTRPNKAQQICRQFGTAAGCRFGSSCRFLHPAPAPSATPSQTKDPTLGTPQAPPATVNLPDAEQTTLSQPVLNNDLLWNWLNKVPKKKADRLLGNRMAGFFQQCFQLVQSNVGYRQQVIEKLASEGGLSRLKEFVDVLAETRSEQQTKSFFLTIIIPLLRTLSYHDVAESAFLETAVGRIHNYLYGSNGLSGIRMFECCTTSLSLFSPLPLDILLPSLMVFHASVEMNGGAKITDQFHKISDRFSEFVGDDCLGSDGDHELARELVTRFQRRLGTGRSIPLVGPNTPLACVPVELPQFDVGVDSPGLHSVEGRRHDNDHAQISDIRILPTADEIACVSRAEYLPVKDPRKHHFGPGIEGILDRQFRLLREDTVGQLRDAVRIEIQRLHQCTDANATTRKKRQGLRTVIFENVALESLSMENDGLHAKVSFNQPQAVRNAKTLKDRQQWWEHSKRLLRDSLLCLVNAHGGVTFFCVCDDRSIDRQQLSRAEIRPRSIYEDPSRARISIRLATSDENGFDEINDCLLSNKGATRTLCEFPGILLPTFYHTLEALQRMSRTLDLPFSEIVAPSEEQASQLVMAPPRYALEQDFKFDMSCLVNGEPLDLAIRSDQPFDYDKLRRHSTLDTAQQTAVINSLGRRFALIQGPPGTGKSYTGVALIKVLLANAEAANLGPILCVCYTNHALDQLLEHLVRGGVEQVIRIGARSKSELLKDLTLQKAAQNLKETPVEAKKRYELRNALKESRENVKKLLLAYENAGSWESISEYLGEVEPGYKRMFDAYGSVPTEDGWTAVSYDHRNPLERWLACSRLATLPAMRAEVVPPREPKDEETVDLIPMLANTNITTQVQKVGDSCSSNERLNAGSGAPFMRSIAELRAESLHDTTIPERQMIYQHWVDEIRDDLKARLSSALDTFGEIHQEHGKCKQEHDWLCLQMANIIGVTTSGLARNLDLLRRLPSKVIICEEAGEVLEAHLLTALLPSIQHAILIGDHEQLRPQIQNYDLQCTSSKGKQYSLDVSLFERLIHPFVPWIQPIPFSALEIQRRMHPFLSQLVRETLYPKLQDHPSVEAYPMVKGFSKRLFWLDHQHPEAGSEDTSHTNDWEVEMTAALVTHLVRQGIYQSEDIAVLTPYLGQLSKLRRRLASSFEVAIGDADAEELEESGLAENPDQPPSISLRKTTLLRALRLATVDNFQGEEAKVIIVSLVRSNKGRQCGFLRTTNRINVLLSRAQHGMYLIGDSECYGTVDMWSQVLQILRDNKAMGSSLALSCPRHPEVPIEVSEPEDFLTRAPEGGCDQSCQLRLPCGHACINRCHANFLHSGVLCQEACPRFHPGCDHSCPKLCGEKCGKCQVKVLAVTLGCGHVHDLACYQAQSISSVRCREEVGRTVPGCEHQITVECPLSTTAIICCPAICGALLPCGHTCTRPCTECNSRDGDKIKETFHGPCRHECGRDYTTCNHRCQEKCHMGKQCSLCTAPCDVSCVHSRCTKRCQEPCAPCAMSCTGGCPHRGRCDLPCAVPCELLPCSKRCEKLLDCGHQCPSVCGEVCPASIYCQLCCSHDIRHMEVDLLEKKTYADINLDTHSPCVFPSCGHIMTMESMDGIMSMDQHYTFDETGEIIGLNKPSESILSSSSDLKGCPMCRMPLRTITRYNRIVRRGQIDENTKRFISWSNAEFVPLTRELREREIELSDSANNCIRTESSMFFAAGALLEGSAQSVASEVFQSIKLIGNREEIIQSIRNMPNLQRYALLMRLRANISQLLHQVVDEEQPYGRVYDFVKSLRRRQGRDITIAKDDSMIQTRAKLLAHSLFIRCDLAIVSDFVNLGQRYRPGTITVDTETARHECDRLANSNKQPMIQVEANIYWARFASIEASTVVDASDCDSQARMNFLKKGGHDRLTLARLLCSTYPGQTRGLMSEVDSAASMLQSLTFYAVVTSTEKEAVFAAMAAEFQGTGHWYVCENGHPFTIGECGMPMERGSCPQCRATVGGNDHALVQGVERDMEMDGFATDRVRTHFLGHNGEGW